MPLIQSKSKKALKENIATEMEAHPEKKSQDLAIAYSIQRRNKKKKMAQGGEISAADEKRPMPEDEHADKAMAARNSGAEAPKKASWIDDTWSSQASESKSKASSDIELSAQNGSMDGIDDAVTPEEMDMIRRHRMAKGGMAKQHANESSESSPLSPHKEMSLEDIAQRMNELERKRDMLAHGGMPKDEDRESSDMIQRLIDKRQKYAEGGEVADVSRNADEDHNFEDQVSFDALRKENYSESEGLNQLDSPEDSNLKGNDGLESDEHDHISEIRRKMRSIRR